MRTPNKILNKHLGRCFAVHHKQLPIEYESYIIRAMQEYKKDYSDLYRLIIAVILISFVVLIPFIIK